MRRPASASLVIWVGALLTLLLLGAASASGSGFVQAHRGGALVGGKPTYPENTMPAFRRAAQRGFALELDVKVTKDGVPVVFHDATLERMTPCSGEVAERTLRGLRHCRVDVLGAEATLRQLPRGDPRRVPIPTLARVLDLVRRTGRTANIEIKNWPPDPDFDPGPRFARIVSDAIRRSRVPPKQVIVQSFWAANLDVAKRRLPGAETSFLTLGAANEAGIDVARSNGYDWVSPQWPVSEAYVARAHSAGLRVVPYTIDIGREIRAAIEVGVDALITNDPLRARKILAGS